MAISETASTEHALDEPHLAHHFDSMEQQNDASLLGMWLFLVTEVMFFGGAFTAYIVYRARNFEAFALASHHLDIVWGTINTCVLLCSSLSMAMAVDAAHARDRKGAYRFLGLTGVLGIAFLVIKAFEYLHKYETQHMPLFGLPFHFDTSEPHIAAGAQIFFGLYFGLTGLHALHMVIGMAFIALLMFKVNRGRYVDGDYMPVECFGLYWHFVDIVWIFLFPFLYLISRYESFPGH